ncbi:MAG: ABC transporter substrate-binding protein [Pseudolabrys sp.]|jgi:putative ABC transport system substrate-binding protein
MRRREFISFLGGAAAAWPIAARAQQSSAKVFRIGFLGSSTADSLPKRPEAFRAGLRDLGYQEGRDFVIEYRWADGNYDRLPALIADLVRLKVDVIVTHGTPAALAAKTATTIPVVLAVVGDALGSGIVSSLARPGGNVTGLTFFQPELAAKRLELLKEAMPSLTDVGILLNFVNPMNEPLLPQMSRVAQPLKLELHQFDVRAPTDFEGAFATMAAKRIGALVVIDDAVLLSNAPAVAALALKQRLPSCGWPDFAIDGGLMAYGVDFLDMFRHAAAFVDKILKGAKPGDLPVERATKFETIVNLKTAKALGLTIPYNLLARADQVIE